jgi:hypothetical protein
MPLLNFTVKPKTGKGGEAKKGKETGLSHCGSSLTACGGVADFNM